ncbi:MAG: valine--tRNA ligase, partial [Chlamydiia bacterium]|nr:valine--tRNA ligase [Chlamydiia bacterium]
LCATLRLIHPMTPFITEELFSFMKDKFSPITKALGIDVYTAEAIDALNANCCMQSAYPTVVNPSDINPSIEMTFAFMDTLVHAIRNIRAEMQLPHSTPSDVYIIGSLSDPNWICAQENKGILRALIKIETLTFMNELPSIPFSAETLVDSIKIIIPLPLEMREKEKQRLVKEKEKLSLQRVSMKEKLSSQEFIEKAPEQVVAKLSSQLAQMEKQIEEIEEKYRLLTM